MFVMLTETNPKSCKNMLYIFFYPHVLNREKVLVKCFFAHPCRKHYSLKLSVFPLTHEARSDVCDFFVSNRDVYMFDNYYISQLFLQVPPHLYVARASICCTIYTCVQCIYFRCYRYFIVYLCMVLQNTTFFHLLTQTLLVYIQSIYI